jgi:hypothetical protein
MVRTLGRDSVSFRIRLSCEAMSTRLPEGTSCGVGSEDVQGRGIAVGEKLVPSHRDILSRHAKYRVSDMTAFTATSICGEIRIFITFTCTR